MEICRENGRRGAYDAFDELAAYFGKKLGLHSEMLKADGSAQEKLETLFGVNLALLRSAPIHDYLGDLVNSLGIGNSKLGQCFTPSHIGAFIAELLGIGSNPSETIMDPSCGTGSLLLSTLARAVPGETLYGIEIDARMYRACLVQLSLFTNGGKRNPFHILCGNALSIGFIRSDDPIWVNMGNKWNPSYIAHPLLEVA